MAVHEKTENRVQKALWFTEQFGLKILTLEVEQKDGVHQNTNINFSHAEPTTSESGMSAEGKNQIEKVLFLMDKFGVSEEFYYELSIVFSDLPRSYLVKKSKHNLNLDCHPTKTPGNAPGVQCSFKELLKEHISEMVSDNVYHRSYS